jgi:hypothetical protein
MKSVEIIFYGPKEVFSLSKTASHPMYGYDLVKSFYNARYKDDGTQNDIVRATWWGANAGSVQLFDKSTHYPITWEENDVKRGFFSSISINCSNTSYGHSERISMRDLLDSYMKHKNIDPHDIKNPSHSDNIKDKNNSEYDILKGLKENASTYKSFLVGSGIVVKFWSERVACDYETGDGSGGKCTEFIKNICPTGSKYGYITKTEDITFQTDKTDKIKERNKLASTNLKTAYEAYDYVNTLIQNILQNFESKVDDKESKQLQIDNNIQISNLTQRFNDLHINIDIDKLPKEKLLLITNNNDLIKNIQDNEIDFDDLVNLPLEILRGIVYNKEVIELLQNEDITLQNLLNLHSITEKHKQNFSKVIQNFIEAIEKEEYLISEILERYNEDSLHMEFMARDPDDIVLENSDDARIVQFGIKNYDIDVKWIEDTLRADRNSDDLDSAALMDFRRAMGSYEEEVEEEYPSEHSISINNEYDIWNEDDLGITQLMGGAEEPNGIQ